MLLVRFIISYDECCCGNQQYLAKQTIRRHLHYGHPAANPPPPPRAWWWYRYTCLQNTGNAVSAYLQISHMRCLIISNSRTRETCIFDWHTRCWNVCSRYNFTPHEFSFSCFFTHSYLQPQIFRCSEMFLDWISIQIIHSDFNFLGGGECGIKLHFFLLWNRILWISNEYIRREMILNDAYIVKIDEHISKKLIHVAFIVSINFSVYITYFVDL